MRWGLFAGIAVLATVAMLALARASARTLRVGALDASSPVEEAAPSPFETPYLLANVAASHGLLGTLLVAAAWIAEVPPGALGLGGPLAPDAALGLALGALLYVANEAAVRLADVSGVEYDERLRELLAPDSAAGWAVLLLVVLPVVAGVEELLFRGALVGALAAGFGLPAWGLAAVSSALFGLGHGLQGRLGVVVTAALGFALAATFVLTGSLVVVVVAHYAVNAAEFVVHEGPL